MLISSPEFIFYYHFLGGFLLRGAANFWVTWGFLGLFGALEISIWDTEVYTDVGGDNRGLIGCN